ncbi:fatty acid hydroxylase family protein [Aeromonas australiensis]|nr:fatty acid hydroxylase family protein [Aeromonas australiensis]
MHKINSISVLDDIKVFVFDKLVLGFMYSFLFGVAYYTKAETINILSYLGVPSLSYEVTFFLTFLFTLGAVIVFDFATFIEHYLAHKIRFLWEFHKVHHIPETLNPLTAYRSHPVNQGMFVIIAGVFSGFYSGALNVFFTNQNLFLIFADQNVLHTSCSITPQIESENKFSILICCDSLKNNLKTELSKDGIIPFLASILVYFFMSPYTKDPQYGIT